MKRRIAVLGLILVTAIQHSFAQTNTMRDYVGIINQVYHPEVISFMEEIQADFEKSGNSDAVKSISYFLEGLSGTGFVYVAPDGSNYILTNYHVIAQAISLKVTFEKTDGTKTSYDNLAIVSIDEDIDLALLKFPAGVQPFAGGLTFNTTMLEDGTDVFSAGFPGMGNNALWQFGKGIVSNSSVRLPVSEDSTETRGPYIQHTAQVDPGNSGGPLLIAQPGAPGSYAVAGINTLKVLSRQAANYAIPSQTVLDFIGKSLAASRENEQELLEARVQAFMDGLTVPKAVYDHIAKFLSTDCVALNAKFAISELDDRGSKTVWNSIARAFSWNPVDGMRYAVGWLVEDSIRSKSGAIKISLDTIEKINDTEYSVSFDVSGNTVTSAWVKEFGIWRINTFGGFASGDKTLVEEKERLRTREDKLKTDYFLMLSAGYTQVFGTGPALNANISYRGNSTIWGVTVQYRGSDYMQTEFGFGAYMPIRLNGFAVMPLIKASVGFMKTEERDDSFDMNFGISAQGGVMFTTAAIPGLFLSAAYQYNFYLSTDYPSHLLLISLGYGFSRK
ncbi:S1C family serine protease [Breznakiella homolactica]|uniref:Trypsin-like peptidase domain-containing protein n=1 Tax=Breznakiella homolactica TaxID=2798577 RepID=A0A7T7XQV5_9SPIR|nr:serine protease [Breznakiella homolactica]QQO10794.1 serine protease [Breznakiella homolactica]